jgi:hypothetical protein
MKFNQHYVLLGMAAAVLFVSGCGLLTQVQPAPTLAPPTLPAVTVTSTLAPSDTPVPPTTSPEPSATPRSEPTLAPSPTELAIDTNIAYVQEEALKVTHISAGKVLGTKEYLKTDVGGGFFELGWAPGAKYLAASMLVGSMTHLFMIDVSKEGKPIDLGFVYEWAWSQDGKVLAYEQEYELWLYYTSSGQKQKLTNHLGVEWLWSKLVFTPAQDALIVVGSDIREWDNHGRTNYRLYRIPLDGSLAGTYPSKKLLALTTDIKGKVPLALRFSPDHQKLAIITADFIENCADQASYTLANPDGSEMKSLPVPSLAGLVGPNQDPYFTGDSFAWTADSGGLWVNGVVRDCTIAAAQVGKPRIAHVTLDGVEHEVIPGDYGSLSLDSTGAWLGVVSRGKTPHVQILGLDGHLVLDLGEGTLAQFQP